MTVTFLGWNELISGLFDIEAFDQIFYDSEKQPVLPKVLSKIKEIADDQPYYKYNGIWSRHMENASFVLVFLTWIGGEGGDEGKLLTYEEVARRMARIWSFGLSSNRSSNGWRWHEISFQHRGIPSVSDLTYQWTGIRSLFIWLTVVPACCKLCHNGELFSSTCDQSICQRTLNCIPSLESQER